MKSTLAMNYRMLSSNIDRMSNRLYALRHQAATGKQMNLPSDNPAGIRPVLKYRLQIKDVDRRLNQISMALGEMEILDSSLDQVENILVVAKEAAIGAMNAVANQTDLETYADRIGKLFDEMLQAANTQSNGKYLYSGYRETTRPFTVNAAYDPAAYDPADPMTWAAAYHGDANVKTVETVIGKSIQTALPGNDLFLGDADNDGQLDPDGVDLFSMLKDLEATVRNNDFTAMEQGLGKLEQGADQVRRLRGRMGNNAWRIEQAGEHLETASIEFKKIISSCEDADILEVFSRLVQHETAFEAALNVTTRIARLSILDFMR
ncbi:MAG: flagellar hook-associated protein 3 [Deltaproteobacteria bacterium]|nr:flagellar hook-associated protein 3 [Deltaproteobacteria bacterium]